MTSVSTALEDAVVVYESMFGSTRAMAEAIAEGLGSEAVSIAELDEIDGGVRLLVAGAPTHVHGLSRPETRAEAVAWAADPARELALERGHERGMRDWLVDVAGLPSLFVSFDTRADMPALFSGAASRNIATALSDRGGEALEPPMSFFVDKRSHLLDGEVQRAYNWGVHLRALLNARRRVTAG